MAFRRNPWQEVIAGLGEPPQFLKVLLGTLAFGCLADAVEPLRAWAELLRLGPAVWESGHMWRLVTYGLVGHGGISAWAIVQLVLVYWLVLQMATWLRASQTRLVLLGGIAVSGTVATRWLVPLQLLMALGGALGTGDLGGFAGIAVATAWGWRAAERRR